MINFPRFDGNQPQLWKSKCESYFDMYEVHYSVWVRVAIMHFDGRASRWLQSVERRIRQLLWLEFCSLVHDRFGREQHESLIRQLFHIKQLGSVADYVEQFLSLVDELAAYESRTDPLYYTMRFIDVLRSDIKPVVMVQRPSDLDIACALALVQEEAADATRPRRHEPSFHRTAHKTYQSSCDDIKHEGASSDAKSGHMSKPTSQGDKLASLRSYRRARGLCDRCAEKWSYGHKCASSVQLHALEEVLELISNHSDSEHQETEPPHIMMALSQATWSGAAGHHTLKFRGSIQSIPLLILVDSGSSHTFLSSRLLSSLQGISDMPRPMSVQVANGEVLSCQHQLLQMEWFIQDYSFVSDIVLLPLSKYDLVVGMDWLETFSPMKVDWASKWMAIPYKGTTVLLHGLPSAVPAGTTVQVMLLSSPSVDTQPSVATNPMPPAIVQILEDFAAVFADPVGLPPSRDCYHAIPLIQGAQPFSVRPYRYPPVLKDEIERQVADMLSQGVIQKSQSPFASPVLLVKKKDGTWRFCVDYRHLNALTLKSKYPVPIFDQLMDELTHARWFSKLNLKASYHQILLQQGEEYKIAFQTHTGHFEF